MQGLPMQSTQVQTILDWKYSSVEKFKYLIASRPVSVGVEGLREVCNNLIINTLPWTHAQYEQLIGRLHRLGQHSDVVHVHVIKASMAGYAYDQNKWIRIEFKRSLAKRPEMASTCKYGLEFIVTRIIT